MKRALCIWLPNWPLQRLAAARAELSQQAVVLYQLHRCGGAKVAAYCPRLATAAAAPWEDDSNGIRPGMPLAEALALLPLPLRERAGVRGRTVQAPSPPASAPLHLETLDPAADRLALDELAEWSCRFAPTVGLEESPAPESLLLDVTGLGDLFGGEAALARHIGRAFHKRGLTARVVLADTLAAAWALARFALLEIPGCHAHADVSMPEQALPPHPAPLPRGERGFETSSSAILSALAVPLIIAPGQSSAALAALPPAALRLPAETCALLADLGLRRIEQLAALRRETLLARFGPLVLHRLDQARGAAAEAIVARAVPPEWLFEWAFEHPTGRREMIEWTLGQLVARACAALARGRQGMLRLECRFEFERCPDERFVVGFYCPSASERHVGDLLRLKLERLRFREPLVAIRLQVLAIDRLEFRQREFFADGRRRDAPGELAALVDRLSNRLGPHAVVRPWLLADAQPEFACQYQAALCPLPSPTRGEGRKQKPQGSLGDRPLHLEREPRPLAVLSVVPEGPPVKFRYAGRDQRIARTWGPERIETGWWRGGCVRRDYYQVETTRGCRYWLFRELNTGRWFLHGTFT